MHSLQNRIFLFVVLLLLFVQAIAFWTLISGKQTQEMHEIDSRLTTAKSLFTERFNSRDFYLAAFAKTVAQDYGIKQAFGDDRKSLLVALNNHRERIDADLVMAVSPEGDITAQLSLEDNKVSLGAEQDQPFRYPNWLGSEATSYLYFTNDRLYQLSLSPLKVGSTVLGWVGFGFEINRPLAKQFFDLTRFNTNFVYKSGQSWKLIAASNQDASAAFAADIVAGEIPQDYIAISHIIDAEQGEQFGLAMYGLRDDFVSVLQAKWWQLVILTILTLVLSLVCAYYIARSITSPIKQLVKQAKVIAGGDYRHSVILNDTSELGQLADEFNTMQTAVLTREQAITHRANHQSLTELPNRNLAIMMIQELVSNDTPFGLFHLNLSRVKDVNESLGHELGDRLIKTAAKRLTSITSCCFLGHLGGDEFILIVKKHKLTSVEDMVETILETLEPKVDLDGIVLQLQSKIGVAFFPQHCADGKSILQLSDTALNFARKHNQTVQVYDHSLDINSGERLELINDLKDAIKDDQLELHYQPKLDMSSGVVTHAEALVRWIHPTKGMIPPDNFISIAEQTGQINALTRWVFIEALNQYNRWKALDIFINIAVNISAENLKSPSFSGFIRESVEQYDVPSHHITLEVTESAVVDNPQEAIELLKQFQLDGFKISIDDYGTGYSSLAQLKQLPVNELKIDKSFVQRLATDEDDRIIVRSTIELAHNMGLSVVAEGIEDQFALTWLAQQGCELAQGYFISRPQPARKLTPWLQQSHDFSLQEGN